MANFEMPKLSRVTVVETVYHQNMNGENACSTARYSIASPCDEQPFRRDTKAGEAWKPVECGWIKQASVVTIENKEPQESGLVLEVSYDDAATPWLVYPGESMRGRPGDVTRLRVRSLSGVCRYTVFMVPCDG